LGVGHEQVGHPRQADDDAVGDRRPARRDQDARHVVRAVAHLDARHRVLGVLERADAVAHRDDVGEARFRRDHAVTSAASKEVASSS
jgi:hypothetical protein